MSKLGDTITNIDVVSDRDPLASYKQNVRTFKATIEALTELVSEDDVDLIFLTAWFDMAPRFLAPALKLPNVGFLDWHRQPFDFTHNGKGVALLEAERNHFFGGKVVWVDDFAIRKNILEEVTSLPDKQILAIETTPEIGLTVPEINKIRAFFDS